MLVAWDDAEERTALENSRNRGEETGAVVPGKTEARGDGQRAMKSIPNEALNPSTLLPSPGKARRGAGSSGGEVIFSQGDPSEHVLYIQKGGVKLSVLSRSGRQGVVAMLGPGQFFGEGGLAGQRVRMGSATATVDSTILFVDRNQVPAPLPRRQPRPNQSTPPIPPGNTQTRRNLTNRLSNPTKNRRPRPPLLLPRPANPNRPAHAVPPVSQETLAEMVGTTRSRVNFFMKKFQRLGFIDYTDGLKVNNSLLTVVLHD